MWVQSISGMGTEHEVKVGQTKAQKLLAPFPLPRVGYETSLKSFGYSVLYLGNYGGTYLVTCASYKSDKWLEIFGVKV